MGNIFSRPSRRTARIDAAEYEQVTGKKPPAPAKPPPMKSTPVSPRVPARSKMGPFKNNKRK